MPDRRKKGITLNDKISAASLIVGLVIAACLTYSVFVRNDAVYAVEMKAAKCRIETIVKSSEQQQKTINMLMVNSAKFLENKDVNTEALRQVTKAINNMSISFARVDERLGSVERKLDIKQPIHN